ncbi:uncharacterized protein LOC118269019 isoform X2 [Spodoptera frugiperda]|uniref:Uncharacterized protein LOC118269019 isoform X2 n=1 Tax=Spodoptera frugiperda TaxID=7108 RepID=A0A9R0E2I5_SPOFR|nr:uncharacterized protein LOC118269019 isoform X2 [Spodoptera frugiperda]
MGAIMSFMSNIMYLSEKVILYSTCVGLVCSVVLMFVVTLGMGIGLGYNYCFVDMKTKYKYIPGHYVYPHNLRFPYYYRRSGDQAQDPARAAEEELENDQLRKGPMRPPETGRRNPIFDSPTEKGITDFRRKLGLVDRDYSIFANGSTTEEYDLENEEEVSNGTVAEVDIGTQFDNITTTAATTTTEVAESTETITTTETVETEETTETLETTDTTDVTDSKTDDMYSIDDPTPEPAFPDEKRRVKKLVIPISGLDLVSLLSKLSAEKNNHSLQIVTT